MSESTNEAEAVSTTPKQKKKKILSDAEYTEICDFINNYVGLAIDCTLDIIGKKFVDIDTNALHSIIERQTINQLRFKRKRPTATAKQLLERFENESANSDRNDIILTIAKQEAFLPVNLCKAILKCKYPQCTKYNLSRYLKHPHLIEDPKLSGNIAQCLFSDCEDGPLIDLRRRLVGEEYEVKLKSLAKQAGLFYYDETDLKRLGYDKTPDIKMILPFLYKEEVIHWVESKAYFGDCYVHQTNIQNQLNSYCNRFGPGLIIYWFGYHEDIPKLPENRIGITVLDDFPDLKDITILNVDQMETGIPKPSSETPTTD